MPGIERSESFDQIKNPLVAHQATNEEEYRHCVGNLGFSAQRGTRRRVGTKARQINACHRSLTEHRDAATPDHAFLFQKAALRSAVGEHPTSAQRNQPVDTLEQKLSDTGLVRPHLPGEGMKTPRHARQRAGQHGQQAGLGRQAMHRRRPYFPETAQQLEQRTQILPRRDLARDVDMAHPHGTRHIVNQGVSRSVHAQRDIMSFGQRQQMSTQKGVDRKRRGSDKDQRMSH